MQITAPAFAQGFRLRCHYAVTSRRDKQPLADGWAWRTIGNLRNLGSLGNLPLTALWVKHISSLPRNSYRLLHQFDSRVSVHISPTAGLFGRVRPVGHCHCLPSASAWQPRQRPHQPDSGAVICFFLKFLNFLKLLIACHALPHAYGFAVIFPSYNQHYRKLLHVNRTAGSDCHHCDSGRNAAAGTQQCTCKSSSRKLHQQP